MINDNIFLRDSQEEQARLYHGGDAGLVYHYFSIHLIMAHKLQSCFFLFEHVSCWMTFFGEVKRRKIRT